MLTMEDTLLFSCSLRPLLCFFDVVLSPLLLRPPLFGILLGLLIDFLVSFPSSPRTLVRSLPIDLLETSPLSFTLPLGLLLGCFRDGLALVDGLEVVCGGGREVANHVGGLLGVERGGRILGVAVNLEGALLGVKRVGIDSLLFDVT
jgi:hypothetical protein